MEEVSELKEHFTWKMELILGILIEKSADDLDDPDRAKGPFDIAPAELPPEVRRCLVDCFVTVR